MIHRPTDCGLAISYPLSYKEFKRELNANAQQRFARDYAQSSSWPGATTKEIWNGFSKFASIIRKTAKNVKKNGVTVVYSASKQDVINLFKTKKVVTFFSHNPNDFVKKDEITDFKRLLSTLNSLDDEYIKKFLKLYIEKYRTNDKNINIEVIVDALNLLIETSLTMHKTKRFEAIAAYIQPEYRRTISRIDIDVVFSGVILPSPAVDFSDGARTFFELKHLIPSTFDGICDFSICYSKYLGDALKGSGTDRGRYTCLVNNLSTDIESRVFIYKHVIEILSSQKNKYDYAEANYVVRKKILEMIEIRSSQKQK